MLMLLAATFTVPTLVLVLPVLAAVAVVTFCLSRLAIDAVFDHWVLPRIARRHGLSLQEARELYTQCSEYDPFEDFSASDFDQKP